MDVEKDLNIKDELCKYLQNSGVKISVYIASPYSIGDKQENVQRQIDVANELIDIGLIPYAPLLTYYLDQGKNRSYEFWMDYDLYWLSYCDFLIRLHGESSGADREVVYANHIGTLVFYSVDGLIKYLFDELKNDM